MTNFDEDGPDLPPFRAFSAEDYRRLSRYDEAVDLLRDFEASFGFVMESTMFSAKVREFLATEPAR